MVKERGIEGARGLKIRKGRERRKATAIEACEVCNDWHPRGQHRGSNGRKR